MYFFLGIFVLFQAGIVYGLDANVCTGASQTLTCADNTLIQISDAYYGRNNNTACLPANQTQTTTCRGPNDTTVATNCNGQQSCTVNSNSDSATTLCPNTTNYLIISYSCVETTTTSTTPTSSSSEGPRRCTTNEWKEYRCKPGCQSTCNGSCVDRCAENGCVCIFGTVRDTLSGMCMKAEYCPLPGNVTANHEVYSCKANCGKTCGIKIPMLGLGCVPGYVCKDPYVRNQQTRQCVLRQECPGGIFG